MKRLFALGLLLRVVLFVYSIFQDSTPLKFTDIDYSVFSDAALLVSKGISPYKRSTYRYTPLLAFLNIPNHFLFSSFGKWIFAIGDLIAGLLMTRLAEKSTGNIRYWILGVWILNPFVAVISMRGSAESVVCLLILATLEAVRTNSKISSILFGLSVHFKIFPIIYALPIWFNIPYRKNGPRLKYFWSWKRVGFGLISAGVFLGLTAVFYMLYGFLFLS